MSRRSAFLLLAFLAASCSGTNAPLPPSANVAPASVAPGARAKAIYLAGDDAIYTFPATASGRPVPSTLLKGRKTQLRTASPIYVSPDGTIWTCNQSIGARILAFAPGAKGNAAPKVVIPLDISCSDVGANNGGVGMVYQPNTGNKEILGAYSFWRTGNTGKPNRTLAGKDTRLNYPVAFAYGGTKIYVETEGAVLVFNQSAKGNVRPLRAIDESGTLTGQIAVDGRNRLLYATSGNGIVAYSLDGTGQPPSVNITGDKTKLDRTSGVAIDAAGYLYALNDTTPHETILVYAPRSNGNVAPVQVIAVPKGIVSERLFVR